MPPIPHPYEYKRVPPPRGLTDLPRYLRDLLGGFFVRLGYIFRLVWESGPIYLFLMSFIALFNGLMPLVGALLSREILNRLQDVIAENMGGHVYTLPEFWGSVVMLLLIFYFLYRILSKIVTQLSHAINRLAGERVVRHVKVRIMQKADTVDLASFDLPQFYEKLENANREAGMRPVNILNSTFSVISTLISLVGYIIILAQPMPLAAVAIIAMSIPSTVINFIYRRRTFSYMRRRSVDRRQMNYYSDVMVNKDLAKEIRIFGLGEEFTNRYNTVFDRYYKGLRSLTVRENVWQIVFAVLSSMLNCFFFAFIAFGVFRGEFRIGDYSLYTGALTSIGTSVGTLITTSASIYEGTLFIDNLLSFLKEKQTIVPRIDEPLIPTRGIPHTVVFENVSFAYPDTEHFVLRNVNLTLAPGQTVALVGLNGAGKTTLIKLLTRLYDPTEGRILLDGRDLRDYDVKELYHLFGIIFQDFGKYAATAGENIAFGDIRAPRDDGRLHRAAEKAGASPMLSKLAQGYDTQLMRYFDRNGTELSGGQWQKLSVARAFYSDADILILDEPTASLDPMAEQEIFRRFDELRGNKTTVFVSHRLSSATVASKIAVLEDGMLIEEGTHAELMEQNGKYAQLFRAQAERYIEK